MKNCIELIADERLRQLEKEGFTFEHDDGRTNDELLKAAIAYLVDIADMYNGELIKHEQTDQWWPFTKEWWKPTPDDHVRQLTKAGALIGAEIDRLQRLNERK